MRLLEREREREAVSNESNLGDLKLQWGDKAYIYLPILLG